MVYYNNKVSKYTRNKERRMLMYKRLLRCVREYKRPTFLTLLFIVLEAVIECLIPFTTAEMVEDIKMGAGMPEHTLQMLKEGKLRRKDLRACVRRVLELILKLD